MLFHSFELNINVANCYVGLQLSAFSTLWAKNYLTEMVEGHILCLDRGEEPEEACGSEDSEAVPVGSDPWLQGCQAVVNATPQRQAPSKQVRLFLEPFRSFILMCLLHNAGVFLIIIIIPCR